MSPPKSFQEQNRLQNGFFPDRKCSPWMIAKATVMNKKSAVWRSSKNLIEWFRKKNEITKYLLKRNSKISWNAMNHFTAKLATTNKRPNSSKIFLKLQNSLAKRLANTKFSLTMKRSHKMNLVALLNYRIIQQVKIWEVLKCFQKLSLGSFNQPFNTIKLRIINL